MATVIVYFQKLLPSLSAAGKATKTPANVSELPKVAGEK
jgi:hypothetical protein